jgi:outer membrane protein OmpA-like peptidoglycan-associated protein
MCGALLAGGCATKKYVRNTTAPVQAKVDEVGDQTNRNAQSIEETRGQVKQVDERATSGISAAQERASAADAHAGQAMNRANQAAQVGEKNTQEIGSLRQSLSSVANVITNIDDYKLQTSVSVPFSFDRYALTPEAKADLDKVAAEIKNGRRYFVAVEGYTDSVGSKQYNEALSRRRADAVVQYLVTQHDIPIYRIHMIGLGDQKPVEEAPNRAARAKNRRVEVKVFSADHVGLQGAGQQTTSQAVTTQPPAAK